MTSYNFEVICKNALIDILKREYNEEFTIQDLHMVWFAKELQNYKCTICDLGQNMRYYECTYSGDKDQLFIDIYQKEHNIVVYSDQFNTIVDNKHME